MPATVPSLKAWYQPFPVTTRSVPTLLKLDAKRSSATAACTSTKPCNKNSADGDSTVLLRLVFQLFEGAHRQPDALRADAFYQVFGDGKILLLNALFRVVFVLEADQSLLVHGEIDRLSALGHE